MKKKTPEHTPGPWIVSRIWQKLGVAGAAHDVGLPHGHEGIAKVWAVRESGDGLANAHLVAAAPEMLAALKSLEWAGYHEDHYPLCPSCGNRKLARNPKHKEDCILANAIAKAEGKKP